MNSSNLFTKEEINKKNSLSKLKKIKSSYILKIILYNLQKKKILDIIKYNEKIKKRINININDYNEYSLKFSSIEIEIKPVNNKYNQFINIERGNKKYYHIYFNNNKKEIKRNHIN